MEIPITSLMSLEFYASDDGDLKTLLYMRDSPEFQQYVFTHLYYGKC